MLRGFDKMDLLDLRNQLDSVDSEIVKLYEKRMDLCAQVAQYKIETGKQVYDRQREMEKLEKVASQVNGDFNKTGIKALFEQLMSMSRKLQYRMLTASGSVGKLPFIGVKSLGTEKARVVFQGAQGAYSQIAMNTYFGEEVNSFHVDSFRDAFRSLDEGSADFAVLPIENSTAGTVNEIYELLVEFEDYIVGEQIIKIEHCLLGVKGASLSDIRSVYSHPQSLMKNNAFAAKKVADDNDKEKAAIASEYAAKLYGLEVLKKGVNDNEDNSTRFIIVTNQKVFKEDAGKISICFEIPHESGSLYHMLSHFIYNNLNLTKIESRPIRERAWEYRFFIDFEGNLSDESVKNALRGLREEALNLRILGNY